MKLFDDVEEDRGYVSIACLLLAATAKAIRIDAGTKQLWVPKSLLPASVLSALPEPGTGKSTTIQVAEWFAKKEGLI